MQIRNFVTIKTLQPTATKGTRVKIDYSGFDTDWTPDIIPFDYSTNNAAETAKKYMLQRYGVEADHVINYNNLQFIIFKNPYLETINHASTKN